MHRNFTDDEEVVFVRWFTHYKTKKRIYPKKGEVFVFRPKKRK